LAKPFNFGNYVIDESGCWIWQGAVSRRYGQTSRGRAHRVIWEQLIGPIPPEHDLHHLCSNPLCVNPEHLEARRPQDHRGRPSSFTDAELRTILHMVRLGRTLDDIAEVIGVDRAAIARIKLAALYRRND
jgi:hypothetical protein